MPLTHGVCGKSFGSRTPDTPQMSLFGTLQAACQSLKGSSPSGEVLRAPGPVESWGRPPSCHRCHTTSWLEETRRSSKNHLAENDWGGPTVTEFRGSHSMDEGKGTRYLASGRQYGNALLGVRHQEEEVRKWQLHPMYCAQQCYGDKIATISDSYSNNNRNNNNNNNTNNNNNRSKGTNHLSLMSAVIHALPQNAQCSTNYISLISGLSY